MVQEYGEPKGRKTNYNDEEYFMAGSVVDLGWGWGREVGVYIY